MSAEHQPKRITIPESAFDDPQRRLIEVDIADVAIRHSIFPDSDENALYGDRAENGRLVIADNKHDVYEMTTAAPDPDSDRAHWPIGNPIPDDPDKAHEYTANRRAKL